MSDTDDTDDLLLIPPDFFLVHSEPDPPYYGIVDSLIKQVSALQDRIEGIESMSEASLICSHRDSLSDTEKYSDLTKMRSSTARRYYSHNDLYQSTNTQDTPDKLREKIRMCSLPNTPSVGRFNRSVKFSSPQKLMATNSSQEHNDILEEIDAFMSNVKTIQRNHHAVRNLQNEFNNVKNPIIERDVQDTLSELDKQSERISLSRTNSRNKTEVDEKANRVRTWRNGDNISSVLDRGAGARDILHGLKGPKEEPIKPGFLKPNYHSESATVTDFNSTNTTVDRSSDSSSESTQLTAFKGPQESKKADQKFKELRNDQKVDERFQYLFKKPYVDSCMSESIDLSKIDQERNELLQSPLHDNALSVLNMHKQLLESKNGLIKEARLHKKRGINTLSDNLGLMSLADIWGSAHVTQSPGKLSQKLQEENLRRQHCEELIHELQNRNLEFQQKLAVALKVDDTKNKTIQQFREALDAVSARMEKLNEEKATWEREIAKLQSVHSSEIESANQKIAHYEKEASRSLNIAQTNQEKISLLEQRCSNLQAELEQIELKFKELQDNYQKEYDKNRHLTEILSQKEIELKENKTVLNSARQEISNSRKAVEVCQSEFTLLKEEYSNLQAELKQDKSAILNLNEQKRKLASELQTYKQNEKVFKEALEQSKVKLDNTKVELRNFYQGQLEIIVENKRKEMQSQLDQERESNLEEIRRKELSMAKTAATHIKDISDKCALETKLLEQKHQEEIRLYQMQLSQKQKEIDALQSKLAQLPEKRAQIAKQLQKVMESQWSEALKMINGSPVSSSEQLQEAFSSKAENDPQLLQGKPSVTDYDETPVSSRGTKQPESEIQKYINMLLNRPPGNPIPESMESKTSQQRTASWTSGDLESQNRTEDVFPKHKDRKSGKPPWK